MAPLPWLDQTILAAQEEAMSRCPATIVVGPLGIPEHDVGQTDVIALETPDRFSHQDVGPIHPKPSRQRPKLRRRISGRNDHTVCAKRPLTGSDAHTIVCLLNASYF